jgi:2-methylisocitrate lyase-like PEP mutase family enzyme
MRACAWRYTSVVERMQTRMELYDVLDYQSYEDKLDELFAEQGLTRK